LRVGRPSGTLAVVVAQYRTRKARPAEPLQDRLAAHRGTLTKRHRVRNADQLVAMVDELGFCFAFTESGDMPIPACFDHLSTNSEHRKWDWMWGWKDELAEAKRLYYGRLLVKKPTFVSMKMLPAFYATFGRAGEPDDHLEDIRAGRLSDVARRVIEFLVQRGETQTKRLRAELGISSQDGRLQYAKAIDELQRLMYIARVRAVGEGREDYNYTYDLFVRRYPETVRAAERITSADAMITILARLLELAGGVTEKQVARIFDWGEDRARAAARRLEAKRGLARDDGLLVLPRLG
jgi:hypothetical protein